jgi:peptidoglycan/LPS O-acetylase OafA/YrhL
MVASSHIIGNLGYLWYGVSAVVVFYMISGWAMTALLETRFPNPGSALVFYFERFIRLAPQYYLWLAIGVFTALYLHIYSVNTDGFVLHGLMAYLLVIPLGLQRYFGSVDTHIIAQASSLGIEITFYIFSPWVLKSRLFSCLAGCVGLVIFAATSFKILPDNIYTYYNFPGPIIFFILGSFLYKKDTRSILFFGLALILILIFGLPQRFNLEFIIGVVFGLPIVFICSRFPSQRFDSLLGDASYGCFLGHFIVFSFMLYYFDIDSASSGIYFRIMAVVLSCFIGWLSFYLVERPTLAYRRRLRN